jgi:hypothetical protein
MRAGTHPKAVGSVPTGAAEKRLSTSVSRVSRLCPIFRAQPGGVPTERKNGCCAKVQENRKFDQSPAQRVRSKKEMRQTWETPKRAKSDDFGRCGEKAGESQGVVRAPWRTHLPAVRAVLGFHAGVFERAKIVPLGSEAQIITLFQGKQRGHTQNWREISMANRKIKFPLWLMPETKATVERL